MPEIKVWGLSHQNELGLGPFIISAWVDEIILGDILKRPWDGGDPPGRLIREDFPQESFGRTLAANRTLRAPALSPKLRMYGKLSSNNNSPTDYKITSYLRVGRRGLTWYTPRRYYYGTTANTSIQGPLSQMFTSSSNYFSHIADHDLRHLRHKLNSVDEDDARQKYIRWTVLRQLVPNFARYDSGPFKLICDDFSAMNMMVNNANNLHIVAVLDWEWSYAGPRELFWSLHRCGFSENIQLHGRMTLTIHGCQDITNTWTSILKSCRKRR